MCDICSSNNAHIELSCIKQTPNILVLVVNRFSFEAHARKNNSCIVLNRKLHHNSFGYDLLGSIHHLGNSMTSGHYISKLYYANVVYECNDHKISKLSSSDEISDSAYIVFYTIGDLQ